MSKARSRYFGLFPLCLILYEFSTNMSNDMYLPALPSIAAEFLTSLQWVQLTITAWLVGDMAVQLIIGPLADRYGRRPVLLGGGIIFLLSTLGCAWAPTLLVLMGARVFQGVAVCTMMVAGYASVHDLYEDQNAIHVLAWMSSAAVIAPAIGPVLGGLLLLVSDWRMIFGCLFLLAAVALAALYWIMPESLPAQRAYPLRPKVLLTAYRKIITNYAFMLPAGAFGLAYSGMMGWITVSPWILMEHLSLSPAEFGVLQVPVFGAFLVGAQLMKGLLRKMGVEQMITTGLMLSVLSGLALLICPHLFSDSAWAFVVPMAGYAFGFGVASAPLNRTTFNALAEQKGTATCIFYLTMIGAGAVVSLASSLVPQSVSLLSIILVLPVCVAAYLNRLRIQWKSS